MKTAALGHIANIVSGATPKTGIAEFWDGDVEWATPADLSRLDGAYISGTPRKITPAGVRSCATTVLPTGSVLLSSRAPIGHVAINTVPMATNQGFKTLVPGPNLDAKYLYYWLKSKTSYLQSLGNGATFKELSKKTTEQIQVPLPSLLKQRRIAEILDQADAVRSKRRQVLGHLNSVTQAIYHEMFGDPAENPHGLPVSPLDELIEAGRPITYGILKPGPEISGGVPYVRVADMKDGGISVPGVRRTDPSISASYKRSLLREGDLVMSIRGHVGRFAHVPPELDGANITQDSARLSIVDAATSQYVRASMSAPGLQRWMARHTKGVAVQGLNIGDLRKVPIPLPPVEARLKFEARADRVTRQRGTLQRALRTDDELFASLQSRAFRGEL